MKPNVNDLSKLSELKAALQEKGVSRASIETLNNALSKGMVVKNAADLSLLSIPAAELTMVVSAVTFGASQPEPQDFRTIQFTFHPVAAAPADAGADLASHFYGYQFILGYTDKQHFTVEESYPIEDSHVVIIDVDLNQVLDRSDITYRVKTPQGEFAKIDFKSATGNPSSESLSVNKTDLKAADIKVAVSKPEIDTDARTGSYQVKGKVITADSDAKNDGYQIVIWASTADLPDGSPEYLPVAYAKTETGGYFVTSFLLFPNTSDLEHVRAAKVLVAKDAFKTEVPVKLLVTSNTVPSPDGEVTTTVSRIPPRLILVLNQEDSGGKEADCGCNDLNFHEKKVFEEFNYQTVVRTTEPAIIADVIEEEQEIDLGDIYGEGARGTLVPLNVFQKFHAIKTRQPLARESQSASPNARPATAMARLAASPEASLETSTKPARKVFTEFDAQLLDNLIVDYRADQAAKPNKPRVNKGRAHLTPLNQINWDKATIYQAASIAHGHLLHFKQEWIPDGYSIGDLLYSLPLAPGQKKQIAVLDWERRESAANSQSLDYEETLNNSLSRDRDINEVVSATLNENISGRSTAKTGGFGFGLGSAIMGVFQGGSYGGLLGLSGGKSKSSSTASQTSHRDSTANSLQSIRDRTTQAANAVRSQRSTVIQTVSQGERVQATSESVANYNHCHAITIQYFEVVRHFAIHNRFVDAQECLFVPLQITNFDLEKALRWRGTLERCLSRPHLRAAFAALERIQNEKESATENYYDSIGYPVRYFAEQQILNFQGELFMEFYFFNPKDKVDSALIDFFRKFFRVDLSEYNDRKLTDAELAKMVGPRTIEYLLDAIVIETQAGQSLNLDVTLVTPFRQNALLRIALRQAGPVSIARDSITSVRIRIDESKVRAEDATDIKLFLDKYMKILVRSGSLKYRTKNFAGTLFSTRIDNDLFVGADSVFVDTPLTSEELCNPRGEDIEAANNLIHHLNENLEYYHKCLWFLMSDERRYMLLDGIVAPGKANGRSVASVVENRIIGVAGNSIIMPVAPGFQLDPTINTEDPVSLKAKYFHEDSEPMRVSLPTKGVYAEAVIGKCNSCEDKDESKFWRWEESPIPDSPNTQINPINMDTRRTDPGNLQPKDFPAPVVNIQNAPNVPDPTGLANILQLLGKSDSFRDITGLTENQKNALATFQKSLDTAQAFGKEASSLAKTAGMLELIKNAKNDGTLSKEDAQDKTGKAVDAGAEPTFDEKVERTKKQLEMLKGAFDSGNIDSGQLNSLSEGLLKESTGDSSPPAPSPPHQDPTLADSVRRAMGTPGSSIEASSADGQLKVSLAALPGSKPMRVCGFFGQNGLMTEAAVRDAIVASAEARLGSWQVGGAPQSEIDNDHFGHLVRHWLARKTTIPPSILAIAQQEATSGNVNYGALLLPGPGAAALAAAKQAARAAILANAPAGGPANLNAMVEDALGWARESRRDTRDGPWSAVFVTDCVRSAAITLGLEHDAGGAHSGQDALLKAAQGHWDYIHEAHQRRISVPSRPGYQAFMIGERRPQRGDIIVQDRRPGDGDPPDPDHAPIGIHSVRLFTDIPNFPAIRPITHGDIIVDVQPGFVETIGGNLSNGVRRRRYPLTPQGLLVIDWNQLYVQENNALVMPALPVPHAGDLLVSSATWRIFALLSPVHECVTLPGIPSLTTGDSVLA